MMFDASLFSGLPCVIAAPALLRDLTLLLPAQIRVFSLPEPGDASPIPADLLLAVVRDGWEEESLRILLARQGITPPPILHGAEPVAFFTALSAALAAQLAQAARREAGTLEAMVTLRAEAEETRGALQQLRTTCLATLPSQHLHPASAYAPISPHAMLIVDGAFHLEASTGGALRNAAAVALHIADSSLDQGDMVSIRLAGAESGRVFGAWRLPGTAFPTTPGWLTLDMPLPAEAENETASLIIEGNLAPAHWLAFSQSEAETDAEEPAGEIAHRLFTAAGLRLVNPLYWDNATLALPHALDEAMLTALPARCWAAAFLLGGGSELTGTDERAWHLRLRHSDSAMLVFPDVPLAATTAFTARLSCRSGDGRGLTAALAVLPPKTASGFGLDNAVEAALAWSPLRRLDGEGGTVTFTLPPGLPATAALALALRFDGAQTDEFAIISCDSLLLRPGPISVAPKDVFIARASGSTGTAVFEDVRLDEIYTGETYRHLDLSIFNLKAGSKIWSHIKFKCFQDHDVPGLEFRAATGWPVVFNQWPGTEEDAYGRIHRIRAAAGLNQALAASADPTDRLMLESLVAVLPHAVRTLTARAAITPEDSLSWLAVTRALHPASADTAA